MKINKNKYCDEKSTLYMCVLTLVYLKLVNVI